MDIQKILDSGLINTAELARRLWPTNKNPKSKMSAKLSHKNTTYGLTKKDISDIEKVLREVIS